MTTYEEYQHRLNEELAILEKHGTKGYLDMFKRPPLIRLSEDIGTRSHEALIKFQRGE